MSAGREAGDLTREKERVAVVAVTGLEGIGVTDKAKERGHVLCYGAIGIGGAKMKVHRAAVESLFEQHDRILNTAEVFAIAEKIG